MQRHIRNFCIIAHINHGKSTLADRLLEITQTISPSLMREQVLDEMDLERERGITIKLTPVRMEYERNGQKYILNLIDTPGHVDFSYEVSRSLVACEGAVLVVDATKGIQAQTVANVALAKKNNLTIIPVVNKIDLANARPKEVAEEIVDTFHFSPEEICLISAKTGEGVKELLDVIIQKIPPPKGLIVRPLTALVFDSTYDSHKGVIVFVRVFEGKATRQDKVKFLATGASCQLTEVGVFSPGMREKDSLSVGEVGYLSTGLKEAGLAQVGDTLASPEGNVCPLPGYEEIKPMVFASIYPTEEDDFSTLKEALMKLKLSDAAIVFNPESSPALGKGFRCGFLGPLHAEIVQERLLREYGVSVVMTQPTVAYKVKTASGERVIKNISTEWDPNWQVEEPLVSAFIFVPERFLGPVMQLSEDVRGEFQDMKYHGKQVELLYKFPLMEIIVNFFDRLKSVSSGFASIDYRFEGYRPVDAVRLEVFINGERVDALSQIVIRKNAQRVGRILVTRLKDLIPRQLFRVPIQVAIGGKIIARADIPAYRKDVTAKLYGGDRTRKEKLLSKQRAGKKKLKRVGRVDIPQRAFFALFSPLET